ncbi:MAG: hypothetical protein MJ192_08560 [Clostridia bacterium]|nr:hypothetical protein [Clostridia bacterium]
MKIVFLDIDGVLNSDRYDRRWGAELQEHLVRTDSRIGRGLEQARAEKAIALLNGAGKQEIG